MKNLAIWLCIIGLFLIVFFILKAGDPPAQPLLTANIDSLRIQAGKLDSLVNILIEKNQKLTLEINQKQQLLDIAEGRILEFFRVGCRIERLRIKIPEIRSILCSDAAYKSIPGRVGGLPESTQSAIIKTVWELMALEDSLYVISIIGLK